MAGLLGSVFLRSGSGYLCRAGLPQVNDSLWQYLYLKSTISLVENYHDTNMRVPAPC